MSSQGTLKECVTIVREESHLTLKTGEEIFVHDGKFFRRVEFINPFTPCVVTQTRGFEVDSKSWPLCLEPLPDQFARLFTVLRRHTKGAEESHQPTHLLTKAGHSRNKIFLR